MRWSFVTPVPKFWIKLSVFLRVKDVRDYSVGRRWIGLDDANADKLHTRLNAKGNIFKVVPSVYVTEAIPIQIKRGSIDFRKMQTVARNIRMFVNVKMEWTDKLAFIFLGRAITFNR